MPINVNRPSEQATIMDRINGFMQFWRVSSSSRDNNTRRDIAEGHVQTSSDDTFPVVPAPYVQNPQNSSTQTRDTKGIDNCVPPDVQMYNQQLPPVSDMSQTRALTTLPVRLKLVAACNDFSEVTTFHGMRFVCAGRLTLFRRLVWLTLVLVCLSALGIQVYKQVLYFKSNPRSISVETKHVDFVEFPSLTICNENSFKISSAATHKLYDVINKMMSGELTISILKEAGAENLTLGKLNDLLGNHVDTMLLRCRWGKERCQVENFTTIITDHGLCFTFNGPDAGRNFTIDSPGFTKSLRLILNVEEYERMAGPHVASGIHMLVHMKRQYPTVRQFGQAVAAGSHAFVALNLKKEHRLGFPYDTCKEGILTSIPNKSYDYSIQACKQECFTKYVLQKCGCRDYYMIGDGEYCTMAQYVTCLRPAQNEYSTKDERQCVCSFPCKSELVEVSYSYGSLSKSAFDEIDKKYSEKIIPNYRKALDVNEYLSGENQHKKQKYQAFSQILHDVRTLYEDTMVSAVHSLGEIVRVLQNETNLVFSIKSDLLQAQIFVVNKNFIEARNAMDDITLGKIADDIDVFLASIQNKLLATAGSEDTRLKELIYFLLIGEINARKKLTSQGLQHMQQLISAYEDGTPLLNHSIPENLSLKEILKHEDLVPKKLLQQSLRRSDDDVKLSLSAPDDIGVIFHLLQRFLNLSQEVYEAKNMTQEQLVQRDTIVSLLKKACIQYLKSKGDFYTKVIEWPVLQLEKNVKSLQEEMDECQNKFEQLLKIMDRMSGEIIEVISHAFSRFYRLDQMLNSYIEHWNITKLDIAAHLLSNESFRAQNNLLQELAVMRSYENDMEILWPEVDTCSKTMMDDIPENETRIRLWSIVHQYANLSGIEMTFPQINTSVRNNQDFISIQTIDHRFLDLMKSIEEITEDMKALNGLAVTDKLFYSQNLIFLDVFFTDISYTVTEHQIAYDVFNLLSDIGGSMGLLVGASVISLCEFLDFFCMIVTVLCKNKNNSMKSGPHTTNMGPDYQSQ